MTCTFQVMECTFQIHVKHPYFLCRLYVVGWAVLLDVMSRCADCNEIDTCCKTSSHGAQGMFVPRNSVTKPNAITLSRHSDTVSTTESWCANSQLLTALRTCIICSCSGTFSSDACMKLTNWQSGFRPKSCHCSWCWVSRGSIEWSARAISSFECSCEIAWDADLVSILCCLLC
jgi:hypothetical protein